MSLPISSSLILIDKNGTFKEIIVKLSDFHNLYKKAGFTTIDNFMEHYLWEVTTDKAKYSISLWGKKKGKNAKNVYPFPPPLEETNDFCGNVLLMNHKGQQNLTVVEWTQIYDVLCEQVLNSAGELEDEDIEEELEDDYADAADDADDDEMDEHEEEEELYVAPTKSKKKNAKNTSASIDDFVMMNDVSEEILLDCSAELQEEEYV